MCKNVKKHILKINRELEAKSAKDRIKLRIEKFGKIRI